MPSTPRQRRRRAFGTAIDPSDAAKADSTSPQGLLDAIAVGTKHMPALDTYWILYQKGVWVAACVNKIANSVSSGGFDTVAKDGEKDVSKDERVAQIGEFFDNAFTGKITYRRAMFSLSVDIKVFGLGYWRKKRAGKLLVGLERLDPRCVLPRPNKARTEIEKFMVRKSDGDDNLNSAIGAPLFQDAEPVSPNDIVFFTLGGGDQLLGAPSPLEHLDYTLGLDFAIRKFRQSFFNNGAVNGKIIGLKNGTRDDVRALEQIIKNKKHGPENAYVTWVFSAANDFTIMDRGNNAGEQEVDFLKGSGLNRDEVCATYGIPPGILLFSNNALGSSGKEQDTTTYETDTILPLEESIFEIITRDILVSELQIEDLELAPKRRSALRFDMFGSATAGVQIGMTGNESRDLVNLPRITTGPYAEQMEVPLFLGARGQGLAEDEPLPAAEETPEDDNVDDVNDDLENNPDNKPTPPGKKPTRKARMKLSWY